MSAQIKLQIFILLLVTCSGLYSQDINRVRQDNSKSMQKLQQPLPEVKSSADYKVIASTPSYVEIEFCPNYFSPQNVGGETESFQRFPFDNSLSGDFTKYGLPDLMFRLFTVILPSSVNNTITMEDYDVVEIKEVNLVPHPNYKYTDTHKPDFEHLQMIYRKDPSAYAVNKYLPENPVTLENVSAVRDVLLGRIQVHPYQYNPALRTLKKYTRIRFRLNFGSSPIIINRKRSREEKYILKNIAVNSPVACNWLDPSLIHYTPHRTVQNSVLAAGDWYMIEVKDNGAGGSEGIYKLTKSFLESAGINVDAIDPRTIKIFGNGGDMLPEYINDPRPEDLTQIAIHVEGEDDGHFDANDYVLFYGRSVNNWDYNYSNHTFSHHVNYYTNSNYYWLTYGGTNGRRMAIQNSPNVQNPTVINSFTQNLFQEPEINNLLSEGNLWLSDRKSSGESFVWNNTLTGLEPNSNILYRIKPACRVICNAPCFYQVYMIAKEVHSVLSGFNFPLDFVHNDWGNWIWTNTFSFMVNASQMSPPNSMQSSFTATNFTSAPDGDFYYDWMEIQYKRMLNSVSNDFIKFNSPDSSGIYEYTVSPFSGSQIRIFDVTQHDNVGIINTLNAPANSVRFQKNEELGPLSYFMVCGPNGYKTPASISHRITNQNLHGGIAGASFIIITPQLLMPAAIRIKTKREQGGPGDPNYLKTIIVDVQSIYNEFSCGMLDAVAIRDFLKYAYDFWQEKPVYVLLLGDGSFDYKNIFGANGNLVPAFEYTDPNINQVTTYSTDDFYSMFAPNNLKPFLATGRIPARNLDEANTYIDKTDCYENPAFNHSWKNKIVYIADDGWTPNGCEGDLHTAQMERLAQYHTPPTFEKIKIYTIMYPFIITSQGRRKPAVNADIIKYWSDGCIAVDYAGHGSPEVWSNEYIFEKDIAVSELKNVCKYPFLNVASCDFSKFDNPLDYSGGELTVTAKQKGAIGSLGASRPTYSTNNEALNNNFYDFMLGRRDTLLLQTRFGLASYLAKQLTASGDINSAKFILLCDPSSRVQIPRFVSRIDSIRGLSSDTMRALSRIKIFGSVMHSDSSLWSDYTGQISLKIYDVDKLITMKVECGGILYTYNFTLPGGIIYSGTQKVSLGSWTAEFIVPKDISYLNQRGKIIDYFWNQQNDGSGIFTNFIVGGIDPDASPDTTGPIINLYLNNRKFRSGDVVNENFDLIGDLFDESGINTTGTVGHKIEATLDGNDRSKYDLTNFYNSDTSYKSGSLQYHFSSISEGKHTLSLRAWDTYNNSSTAQIEFNVSMYNKLMVTNVFNFPNPFKDRTAFTFQHNYPGPINVGIKIYTVSGRLIQDIERNNISDKFVAIDWDGKDADGETIANGIYLYKVIVTASDGTSQTSLGKLAVLK